MTQVDGSVRPLDDTVLVPAPPAEESASAPTAPVPVVVAPGHGPSPADPPADAGQRFAPHNPHARRLRGRRSLLVGVIVAAAVALLGWSLSTVVLSSPLQAAGVVQADQTAQLNMSAAGPIAAVDVAPGERVKAGQVLATQQDTSLTAKLSADQAKLTSDKAALAQLESGPTAAQREQLQAEVTQAEVADAAAQAKLAQTEQTAATAVTGAQTQLKAEQTLLAADQQTYSNDTAVCTGPSPPDYCGTDERQVQVDESNVADDQTALAAAVANQQAQVSAAQSGVSQAAAALAAAQAAQAVGTQAPTAQQVSAAQAAIGQDQSAIAADEQAISQTVLSAPFPGVVATVGGTVGDIATSQGVRQPTSAAPVSQESSTGIDIFPQSPQQQATKTPTTAPLVQLDSLQTKIVIEVPETDVSEVHVGQRARASLPAFAGASFSATVRQILPTTVNQGGKVYVLVDLSADEAAIRRAERTRGGGTADKQVAGFTVNVSF